MEKNQNRKVLVRRKAKNIAIATVVLLLLLVVGGVAYIWYTGQQGPQPAANKVATETTREAIKPTTPNPNTQESAAIEFLSSPVVPGDEASVNVKTVATSNCSVSVIYNNVPSSDPALKEKVADDFGNVSWNWTVGKSTPTGSWPVKITCSWHGKTAVVQGDLVVAH
jgi:zona occludens toxin (predicted ATPase)